MGNSLADQLLKAKLVDEKSVKKAKKEKHTQHKQARKHKTEVVDENKLEIAKANEEKLEKDRQLNQQKQKIAEEKAVKAQIKQLIESHHIVINGSNLNDFNFKDGNAIKTLKVNELIRQQLIKGQVGIVKQGNNYSMLPYPIVEKIAQRDEDSILLLNKAKTEDIVDEDDPYADYVIPDDLIW
ncbi:MAG: DUF2058 domain-containing protein [Pseudomonadota bacterium]